jgi:hypothetical protein
MAYLGRAARWGGARLSRRLARSIPLLGAFVALATLGDTMRRKGVAGGLADTGLNSIPFVGAAKNVVEAVSGRDLFPDRPAARPARRRRRRREPGPPARPRTSSPVESKPRRR